MKTHGLSMKSCTPIPACLYEKKRDLNKNCSAQNCPCHLGGALPTAVICHVYAVYSSLIHGSLGQRSSLQLSFLDQTASQMPLCSEALAMPYGVRFASTANRRPSQNE